MADTLTVAVFHEATNWALPDALVERIRAADPSLTVRHARNRAELLDALPETNLLIGLPLTDEQLEPHAEHIRWIQLTHSIGDTSPTVDLALSRGIRITSAAPFRAAQIAEHAMALSLALTRRISTAVRAQSEHKWTNTRLAQEVRTLDGSTVGMLAHADVLEHIARRARAFGARTIATGPFDASSDADSVDEHFPMGQLNDVIAQSDVLIIALPRLGSTIDLIGKRQLGAAKPSTIVIDVSRGGILDQDALIDALRRGRIASAGLDVFRTEPLPETSSLWTMANVIVTPHVSGAAPGYWKRATTTFCDNLKLLAAQQPLIGELDVAQFQPARV
ncbi:MAG: NAD(P)-dependent oxidoreductase [Planctomycetota bacterium]